MIKYQLPLFATILAIAITTTMDFTGFFELSALPLFGLLLIFWWIQRLSKEELGLQFGKLKHYGLAMLYPTLVLGGCALTAYCYGDFSPEEINWSSMSKNLILGSTVGTLMLILTEEGFFRGWLWGAFQRAGMNEKKILLVTSLLFTIWHISAITSGTDYGLPWKQVPVYLVNVFLLGMIWGMLRLLSGSIIVASFSHAVWNPFAYEFFGYGEKVGALGISDTFMFGPEVGYLGILLNGLFLIFLWKKKNQLVR